MAEKDINKASLLARWKSKNKDDASTNVINKAPTGINIPLSYGQKRLWFLQQLYPNNAFYNYSEAYAFEGNLNHNHIIESLKQIHQQHDILRTTYHIENNEIYQKVNHTAELDIQQYDFTNLSDDESNSETQKIIESHAKHYFNLTKGPLIKTVLIKISETRHILQITMHHIITDEWSLRILREQLSKLYQAKILNTKIPENYTNIQYADYAFWQLKQGVNSVHLNYWKQQLSGDIPTLNLPIDFSRPIQTKFKGAISKTEEYSEEFSKNMLALSNSLDITPYVLMLSAFYVFLHRCSGQTDVLIGSPISNRDHKSLEDVLGFFIDTIVLRTQIDPTASFKDLVSEVRQNTLDAFSNKNIPFDVLVKELKVSRALATNPFFQVMFVYNEKVEIPAFSEDLKLNHKLLDPKVSKFDLTLFVSHENDKLSTTFEYSTELFEASTIQRFQNYFKLLLESIVTNPYETIGKLQMLTPFEKQLFLNQKSETQHHFGDYNCIHEVIENISKTNPNAVAVSYKDNSLTYKELNDKANTLATYILPHIKRPNEIVGLCLDRSVDMIVGMLAILKAGCAYLPIDLEYPKERIHFMLNDAEVGTIITQQNAVNLSNSSNVRMINIDNLDLSLDLKTSDLPVSKASNDAYIIYTSGSTGRPKGVPITHQNIMHSTSGRLDFYDKNPSAFLLMSSMSFDSSKAGIFWTLCTGGNLVIAEKRIEQDIEKIGQIILEKAVSHTLMLPSLYKMLLEYIDTNKLQSLNTVMVAGEACYSSLCEAHFTNLPNVKLYNEYGPTEASVWCIAHEIVEKDINRMSIPIGKPVANAKIYLMDDNLNLVPFGSIGEIYIGGPGLTNGYISRPELNKTSFVVNPYNTSEKLYKTGDLGKYNNDKTIAFLGRADQQIKIRGYRVELNEIEKAIKSYNETIEEAFVLIKDDTSNFDLKEANEFEREDNLMQLLEQMDANEIETIVSSIKALDSNQKKYLLSQIIA
ncbi:non-ribosomal peptide synthetase [Algibacter luteus]|uniref:non-ribosomal peptide synthetase n=1 Tax=Algibacter luteus TaxID=1178825 RepID=UPI002596B167|nr:amino acid adenylation domain-containing protein [Algibacter luteus]WJJ95636.1 amino acid adenylation domain-containing protein [Algibacter luteus]